VSLDDAEGRLAAQEAQLVNQIADGNTGEPIEELYRRYGMRLNRFGLQRLGNAELAEEMVQETFVQLWRTAGQYDAGRGSVGAFLHVIARSVAVDIGRRPSSRPLLQVEDSQLAPLPDSAARGRAIRRQGGAGRVAPVAVRLLAAAARLLPGGDRARYAEEFRSELWEIAHAGGGRRAQLAYAARVVMSARRLRADLRVPRRRGAAP
jgi:DNA-directed RNA polymerase specialized sigma24 family protein